MQILAKNEIKDLNKSVVRLRALANVIEALATDADTANIVKPNKSVTLADLVPAGNLSTVAEKIMKNSPITDEQYTELIEVATADIKTNSRINGLLVNITAVAQALRTTVLPLIL